MPAFNFRIADEVFQRYPGYVRGVVIAHELANGPSPPALLELEITESMLMHHLDIAAEKAAAMKALGVKLAPGQTAELTIPELPGRVFPAKVVRTSGAISADSRTLLAELEVDNSRGEILALAKGEIVRVADSLGGRVTAIAGDGDRIWFGLGRAGLHLLVPGGKARALRPAGEICDNHVIAPLSRFIPDAILDRFERVSVCAPSQSSGDGAVEPGGPAIDLAARLRAIWGS